MVSPIEALQKAYAKLEETFPVEANEERYERLVTANGMCSHPIQRWYRFKEAFSVELLPVLLEDWKIEPRTLTKILDPFCGVGTSILSAQSIAKTHQLANLNIVAVERNPFIHFVASTKAGWAQYSPDRMNTLALALLNESQFRGQPPAIPDLSSLHGEHIYERPLLDKILMMREAITSLASSAKELPLLLLGFASTLEAVGKARKDGRALRIEPGKQRPQFLEALATAWCGIEKDLRVASEQYSNIQTEVLLGDGRAIQSYPQVTASAYDLILYSPPYVNNIDYSEVYKIELWLCNFISSQQDFRDLRRSTFRSHPSVRFDNPIQMAQDDRMADVAETIGSLVEALPRNRDFNWRVSLFRGYFDDIYISLREQFDVLKPGGWIFMVVGNSNHGPLKHPNLRVTVASDLIIAQIGKALGLTVEKIQVARYPRRRVSQERFLRESIVVFRKPVVG